MTNLERTINELNSNELGRCPVCGDILRTGEYHMYFIQKKVHTKYGEFYNKFKFVSIKELQEKYKNDPECPEALKITCDFTYLPFCTMRCIKPVVAFLNKKEPDEYRYKDSYGLPKWKGVDSSEEDDYE